MSKIICEVCGTSYPETAAQCPICGCVRPGEAQSISGDTGEIDTSGSNYTYVKGGRFSKANVKKRNKANNNGSYDTVSAVNDDGDDKKGTKGLIITAIVLLLAIIAVIIYIVLHFFGPSIADPKDTSGSTGASVQEQEDSTPPSTSLEIPCESLSLDVAAIKLQKQGAARMLYATPTPEDTTDEITYSSSNEDVATVSATGKVTAVGPGQATITITCGEASVECLVDCAFEDATADSTEETTEPVVDEEFKLNRFDITFSSKGASWILYSGKIGMSQITWTSDDETIATIENGKVTAVGSGTTEVHGEYNGEKVSCIIRCSFVDEDENPGIGGSGGGITEDGGSSGGSAGGPYTIATQYGALTDYDISIKVGETVSFSLLDSAKNSVSVTWTISGDSCSLSGSTVTGESAGKITISATYNGETYSCIVRVS